MKWANIWSYTQQDYRSWPSTIADQVQVIRVRSHHHTQKMKLRFSNEFGEESLKFESVTVRILDGATLVPEASWPVTVNQATTVEIFPTLNLISDEIPLAVKPGSLIEIETVVKDSTVLKSGTVSYARREQEVTNYQLQDGKPVFVEQKELFRMVQENERMFFIYGLSGIEFEVEPSFKTIVAFGDSLTQQGFWLDNFKGQLFNAGKDQITVLNRGIGGSRVLQGQNPANDAFTRHGQAGLYRFEKEVYAYGPVEAVICLHGINDLISSHDGSGEFTYKKPEIMQGLAQYAALAHQHGSKIIIGTMAPLGASQFYSDAMEAERQEINQWLRQSPLFDGVIDFDQALADQGDPTKLQVNFDCGDGLHFSDQGGQQLAATIDIPYIESIF